MRLNITLDFFFLDFNNSTLLHTFSTMWAFLCGHHQVLEKLHIKKNSQFFPLKIRDFGKTMTTHIHFTFLDHIG